MTNDFKINKKKKRYGDILIIIITNLLEPTDLDIY